MYWKLFILLSVGLQLGCSCDMDQIQQGCRILNKICSCGTGCISEYRYRTIQECQNALRGKTGDSCFPNPCLNGGSCLQISYAPGYKCRCEGTGYFGTHCRRACPRYGSSNNIFSYDCIII